MARSPEIALHGLYPRRPARGHYACAQVRETAHGGVTSGGGLGAAPKAAAGAFRCKDRFFDVIAGGPA